MENNNDKVQIGTDEYRNLLTAAANYAMLRDVLKTGVDLYYTGESLSINHAAADVVLKYVLGDAYQPTLEALQAKEV